MKRTDNSVDIFAIGGDGTAYTSFVTLDPATGRWSPWHTWIPLGSPPTRFHPGTPISAIKRNPVQEDIFATATDGHVYTSYVLLHQGTWGAWKPWIRL